MTDVYDSTEERRRGSHDRHGTTSDPLRLLIAEDDADYRAWVAALTRRLGFVVDVTADGEAALDRLTNARYDVAIVAQEMPRLSGLGVIAGLRSSDNAKWAYALMLTGRDDPLAKLTALEAGFDDFVSKSSPEAELVAKLAAAKRIAARQRTLDVAVRELYGLATRDELTGLFNRRFFLAELERHLARRTAVVVIMFDLDGFKAVNDTFGHIAGDQVLREVAGVLERNTRPDDLVARYGGDEFIMAAVEADPSCAVAIANRLASEVAAVEWSAADHGTFRVGMSFGIAASAELPEPSVMTLLDLADRDLYRNKWMRRNPDTAPAVLHPPAPAIQPIPALPPEPPSPPVPRPPSA